jgi:hypothetical protein
VALENIARRQKYPCANRRRGCLDVFSCEHIAEHHNVCVYREIKCPFKLVANCSWKGLQSDLKEHAKAEHLGSFVEVSANVNAEHAESCGEESEFRPIGFQGSFVSLMSFFDQLFVHHKRIRDGRMYCAVQLIGTSNEASNYKCEFALRAANGIEQTNTTLLVRSYSEDLENIFNSGQCLCMDEAVVRRYIVENKLNMTVTLSKV